MNTLSDQDLERLDRYLRDELSPQEQAEVALLISTNTHWHDAYTLLRHAQEAGRHIFHRDMRARFARADSGRGNFRVIRLIAVAAASMALVISALLWLLPSRDDDTLMAAYRTFPNIVMPIEKSGSDFTDRERAYQAYELGDYRTAVQRFSALQELQSADSTYLALAYLELGTFDRAEALLKSVRKSRDTRWAQIAEWYQMWLYVKDGRRDDAVAILEQISQTPGHRYEEQAAGLIAKLK